MINVMEMIVNYAIKFVHIGAVTNCQIRRTAGLFRETFLKGIHWKIVGYVREWEIFPCIYEVLLIRFRPIYVSAPQLSLEISTFNSHWRVFLAVCISEYLHKRGKASGSRPSFGQRGRVQRGRDSKASGLLRKAGPRVYRSCKQTEKPAEISCQLLFSDTKGKAA